MLAEVRRVAPVFGVVVMGTDAPDDDGGAGCPPSGVKVGMDAESIPVGQVPSGGGPIGKSVGCDCCSTGVCLIIL